MVKLQRMEEAEESFQAAATIARKSKMHFVEMIALWDLIVHVLDPAGRRAELLAELGKCINEMVLAPAEYTGALGSGIDATEASLKAHNDHK